MQKQEFTFLSYDKTSNIHAVKYLPDDGQYKAILQISHGMIEYIERYEDFARFMTEAGYMVVGHDHIGHGHSVATREDLGYFPMDNPSNILVEDMNTLRTMIQKENEGVPYFMMAHSMGSYLLRQYLAKYNDNLRGVILCGTGYVKDSVSKFGLKVVAIARKLRGPRFRSQFITNMTYGKSYKKFDTIGKDYSKSWLTRDEEIVKKYYNDPLCGYLFTMNGYQGLMETVLFSCNQENVDKIPEKLPIFIVSGSQDPVGDLGVGVKRVYDMLKASGKLDLTYKIYDDMRHEILNEIGKEEVYNDLLAWLNVRIDT